MKRHGNTDLIIAMSFNQCNLLKKNLVRSSGNYIRRWNVSSRSVIVKYEWRGYVVYGGICGFLGDTLERLIDHDLSFQKRDRLTTSSICRQKGKSG